MEIINLTNNLLAGFQEEMSATIDQVASESEILHLVCARLERTWSGSYAGWHGRMYFHNFEEPPLRSRFNGEWGGIHGIPPGWEEKSNEQVRAEIEKIIGSDFSLRKYELSLKGLREKCEKLKSEILIALSSVDFQASLKKEKELYVQVEAFSFGDATNHFVAQRLPTNLMSRDSEAIRQGVLLPSWLFYDSQSMEGTSLTEAAKKFLQLCDRLVRQLEIKLSSRTTATVGDNSFASLHPEIQMKCVELYQKGVYPEAVEKGFKVVRDRLRKLTGHETGSEAFGKGKLHIKGAAAPNVDQDFNEAVKFLTMAVDRFRNEKSHTSEAKIEDPVRAYEYLRLSSLAMHLLDSAEINP